MKANSLGFTSKAAFLVAICSLVAILARAARADDKPPQLTGHWLFNADQSDDAQEKISDAQQNSRDKGNNGGGYPGTGSPRVGIGFPIGGIGWPVGGGGIGRRGGTGNHGGEVSSDDWDRLAATPKFLRIDQRSDQVVVIDDSGRAQTFYPDGKKHEETDASGKKVSTKTEWQGDALVAQTNLSHSTKLTETFRVSEDGKELYVVSRLEAPSLQGPVSIRRVFDLSNAANESNSASRQCELTPATIQDTGMSTTRWGFVA
jgi:hypothetical protein